MSTLIFSKFKCFCLFSLSFLIWLLKSFFFDFLPTNLIPQCQSVFIEEASKIDSIDSNYLLAKCQQSYNCDVIAFEDKTLNWNFKVNKSLKVFLTLLGKTLVNSGHDPVRQWRGNRNATQKIALDQFLTLV